MKRAIKEMLEERLDEASIKLGQNPKYMNFEKDEKLLFKELGNFLPKELIKSLENDINDKIVICEKVIYNEAFIDGFRCCYEAMKMMDNAGQILDR